MTYMSVAEHAVLYEIFVRFSSIQHAHELKQRLFKNQSFQSKGNVNMLSKRSESCIVRGVGAY
jgi:hypothetical protein